MRAPEQQQAQKKSLAGDFSDGHLILRQACRLLDHNYEIDRGNHFLHHGRRMCRKTCKRCGREAIHIIY